MNPSRRNGRAGRRSLVVVAVCVGASAVLYVLAVRTGLGQRFDSASVLQHNYERIQDPDLPVVDVLLLMLALSLAAPVVWAGRRQPVNLALVGAFAAAAVLTARMAQAVLPRPSTLADFDPLYGASFPSGHSAGSMSLALGLMLLAPDRRSTRWLAVAGPALVAGAVLGIPIHRPSDVAAGFLLALAAMTVASTIIPGGGAARAEPDTHDTTPSTTSTLRREAIEAAVRIVGLTLVILAAEAAVLTRGHLGLADLGRSFPVAVLATSITAEAVVAAFDRLRRQG